MNVELDILNKIADDVNLILGRLNSVEYTLKEIDIDLHQVRPAYLQKLKRIESEKTISQGEFETRFGVKI